MSHYSDYLTLYPRGRQILAHRAIVENLGIKLKPSNPIHHRDGNGRNNNNDNLIICENEAYHRLIEMRQKAYRTTGFADWRKCHYCIRWDSQTNMTYKHASRGYGRSRGQGRFHHRECWAEVERQRRKNNAVMQEIIIAHNKKEMSQ